MIHSASSSSASARNDAIAAASTKASAQRVTRGPADQIHIDKAAALRSSLDAVPEVRPEVVARARALAADPSYPSDKIISHVSALIVNSPDLSEDNS